MLTAQRRSGDIAQQHFFPVLSPGREGKERPPPHVSGRSNTRAAARSCPVAAGCERRKIKFDQSPERMAMNTFFEEALNGRVEEIVNACTRCGKCVEICPVKDPAGVTAPAEEVVSGVIDILRTGDGPEASRRWASTCML